MSEIAGSKEIFSFHLAKVPFLEMPRFLLSPLHGRGISGLLHAESFFTMNLGAPVASAPRYNFRTLALFARWSEESELDNFLSQPAHQSLRQGWHVRMRLYRRWGEISELKDIAIAPELAEASKPIVAVTLARLNILQTPRFIKWGKPVESQVRDHKGQRLALAAFRPWNTFCTFSIWKNEAEMLNMVQGRSKQSDGESHKRAMLERVRKDFHHEFSTMRFMPIKEAGLWNGRSDYTLT